MMMTLSRKTLAHFQYDKNTYIYTHKLTTQLLHFTLTRPNGFPFSPIQYHGFSGGFHSFSTLLPLSPTGVISSPVFS